MRLISESHQLRTRIEDELGWSIGSRFLLKAGLLVGRPGDTSVGRPAWVLYESGNIVLRRSVDEDVISAAACYHLHTLDRALSDRHLPLNVRVFLVNGEAWLVDTSVAYQLAGLDRGMLRRGVVVLPTSIAAVDTATGELVLPDRTFGEDVPSGRIALARVMLRPPSFDRLEAARPLLGLARSVVRTADADLDVRLGQVVELARRLGDGLEVRDREQIVEVVDSLSK